MAREFNYSKENYLILARRNKQLQKDFPQIWENIQSCAYCADGRSSIEYARDLVASWLVEDYFLHLLTEAGCEATAAGADKRLSLIHIYIRDAPGQGLQSIMNTPALAL